MRDALDPGPSSSLALGALLAIAVLSPWAFGGVRPAAVLAITLVGLGVVAVAFLVGAVRGAAAWPATPLWPLFGFLGLGLLQTLPLPRAVAGALAPGTRAASWPEEMAVATVLGPGLRPLSLDPDTTLRSLGLVAALGLLAALAAPALARNRGAIQAAAVVAAGGVALAVYAIFARARFGALLYGQLAVPTVSPFGPFVSKNHFASWAVMAALLAAGLAFGLAEEARDRGRDWTAGSRGAGVVAALVAATAMALAVVASLSRGGIASLAAGALGFLALALWRGGRSTRTRLASSLVVAGTLGAFLLAVAPREAQERMRSLGGASFRLDTWRDALGMAAASPLVGHGLGAFHDAYPRFKRGHGELRVEHAENDYVETAAEIGLAGLLLVLAAGGVLLARSRGLIFSSGTARRGIALGAAAALMALGVHSVVDFNLRIPSNATLAAVLASLLAGAAGVRARPLPRLACAGLAIAAALLGALVVALPREPWRVASAEVSLALAASAPEARALRLERSQHALEGALRRRPAHAEAWLMLAFVRAWRGDRASANALARHAVFLDPERPELVAAAARLGAAAP